LKLFCFFFFISAQNQWLEIDIGHPTVITGLVTKGRGDSPRNHWVTKYKVSYSNDTAIWTFFKDANHLEPKVFN
jgi:lactadherin